MNRKPTLNPRILAGRVSNWRNRRFVLTGKGFVVEHATRNLRSSLPVYRNRIIPATGRPRADDAEIYRRRDAAFARARERGTFSPDAYRSVPARDFDCCHTAPAQSAERVLGRGTAARVQEAMRQANSNPWDAPRQPGRPR